MKTELTIIIVSYNTCDILRQCLQKLYQNSGDLTFEVIVVDNASKDNSVDMVRAEFPHVRLVNSQINLGFAAANNVAFRLGRGNYFILLNSDAFIQPNTLQQFYDRMEEQKKVGIAGGLLVNTNGSCEPSARLFPSLLNDFLQMSGLGSKFPKSRFFGRYDRTWEHPEISCETDWVPGAFCIIRRSALKNVGYFDERFFLYFEEVDLCKRMKKRGYSIWYWGDLSITHIGGESSKTVSHELFSQAGAQLTLWRMRSQLLYYRKHKGFIGAWLSKTLEITWNALRRWKNRRCTDVLSQEKAEESNTLIRLMKQAWKETRGGKLSPPKPW